MVSNCILLLVTFSSVVQASLIGCNDPFEGVQLCRVDNQVYRKSYPAKPHPAYFANSITIYDIVELDPEEQTVTLFLMLRMEWNDTRVTFQSNPKNSSISQWYGIDEVKATDLYFPRSMVLNAKHLEIQKEYAAYDSQYFWFQIPHHLEFQQVMKVTLYCSFDFSTFPFDQQQCNFTFGCNANSVQSGILLQTDISYNDEKTNNESLHIKQLQLPFDIEIRPLQPFEKHSEGYQFSHSGFTVIFKRNQLSTLLGEFYAPTLSFAFLSLISYFIDPEVVPGRLGLLVTLYLISSNVYSAIQAPKKRGFSHIEIWMTGIQMIILTAMLEYGVILGLMKFNEGTNSNRGNKTEAWKITKLQDQKLDEQRKLLKRMDLCTFWIVLCSMIAFTGGYWLRASTA